MPRREGRARPIGRVGDDATDTAEQGGFPFLGIVKPEPPARRRDIAVNAFFDITFQIAQGRHLGIGVTVVSPMRVPGRQNVNPWRTIFGLAATGISGFRQGGNQVALPVDTEQPTIFNTFADRTRLHPVKMRRREYVQVIAKIAAVLRMRMRRQGKETNEQGAEDQRET